MTSSSKIRALLRTVACAASLVIGATVVPAHVGSPYLLEGCASCHVGHGAPGQPMLELAEEESCFQCHGSAEKRSRMVAAGRLAAAAPLQDLEQVFEKTYHHPVSEGIGHSPTERLPNAGRGEVNHAECVDCHNPHQRIEVGKRLRHEVSGYSLEGRHLEESAHEYEICLKCHSGTGGADRNRNSLSRDFSSRSRSQHPVTQGARGKRLPSLIVPIVQGARMDCSDCHGNDDASGPRGPHGSDHRYLLAGNYSPDAHGRESAYAYELCYSCHDRSSILGDESFPYHSLHIEGNLTSRSGGTSCRTCHASHGAPDYPHLLKFNRQVVSPEKKTGRLAYTETGYRSGECNLSCHGHNHTPGRY